MSDEYGTGALPPPEHAWKIGLTHGKILEIGEIIERLSKRNAELEVALREIADVLPDGDRFEAVEIAKLALDKGNEFSLGTQKEDA